MAADQKSSKEFRFLSGLIPTYDSEIRAFVLQSHVQKRRLRAQERKRNDSGSAHKGRCGGANCDHGHPGLKQSDRGADEAMDRQSLALRTVLGQGRVDPFRSIAKDLDPLEQRLLDHYVLGNHPAFGYLGYQCFNPSRDIIVHWIIRDKASIWATLAYAATHLEWQGALPLAVHSSKYRALTCHAIHDQLQAERAFPSVLLVLAVCGAICLTAERNAIQGGPEDQTEMSKHLTGLRAILAARGGWRATGAHSDMMCWLLAWVDICTSGAASLGLTSLSSHVHSTPPQDSTHPGLAPSPNHLYAEELIGAYRDFRQMALARRGDTSGPESPSHARTRSPMDLFQADTPAYRLLSTGEANIVRRIAPIFYLNILSWNVRHYSTDDLAQLHHSYTARLRAIQISGIGSLGPLMWGLMTDMGAKRVANPDFVELLARLLYVEERLAPSTRETLARTLLEFLQYGCQQPDVAKAWWTPEQFRDVVHDDLGLA